MPNNVTILDDPNYGKDSTYDQLVQAILAGEEAAAAERYRANRANYPGWGGVVMNAFNTAVAERKEDKATAALKEAARLKTDQTASDKGTKFKTAFKFLKANVPGISDEAAASQAQAVADGLLTLAMPEEKDPPEMKGVEAEFAALSQIYGPDKARTMLATKYAPPAGASGADGSKPFTDMATESRVKLGLVSGAANMVDKAVQGLFTQDGQFKNTQLLVPKSETRIAVDDLRDGLIQAIRATSGATVTDADIRLEVDAMVPGVTDSDAQARAKIDRARNRLNQLHTTLTSGFEGVPQELGIAGMDVRGPSAAAQGPVDVTGWPQEKIDQLPPGTVVIMNGRKGRVQ